MDARQLLADLTRFPWRSAAVTLGERFREDRLGLTASSLTFTTTMALVPLFTVALAVFTAFPMFGKLQQAVQAWLVQSLVPEAIARQVLGYLTQFAGKANRLGIVGLGVLFVTALALVLTIDRTLNSIWRVKQPRPLGQRVLVYWAVMTLGPLLLGASLSLSSYLLSASRGLVNTIPGTVQFLDSRGHDVRDLAPRKMATAYEDLRGVDIVVALVPGARERIDHLPYGTVLLDWHADVPAGAEGSAEAGREDLYRRLASRIRDLMETLCGEQAG